MLKKIRIEDMHLNPFTSIGKEWIIVAAGNEKEHNMMTASWGGLGRLWEKNVATVYVRPSRYTYDFMEKENYFSVCYFGNNKKIHKIGGYVSGRDLDKAQAAGLTPLFDKAVYYKEAEWVFICKKIYFNDILPENFLSENISDFYQEGDFHRMYVGEIIKVLKKS